MAQPAAQPGQRLNQVQKRGYRTALPAANRSGASVSKRIPGAAADGLDQRQPRRQAEYGPGPKQGRPEAAQQGERTQTADDQPPFRHHGQHFEQIRHWFLQSLIRRQPPDPVVNPALPPGYELLPIAIDASVTNGVAGGVIFLRPLALELGLGFPITFL